MMAKGKKAKTEGEQSRSKGASRTSGAAPKFREGLPAGAVVEVRLADIQLEDSTFEFRVDPRTRDLERSIREKGQQFPVILRGEKLPYQLVSGFRRVRAIGNLGWEGVKAIVRTDLSDDDAYTVSFIENERRRSLGALDKANAIVKLSLQGKTNKQIQAIYGIGERSIQLHRRLWDLPAVLKEAVSTGSLDATKALLIQQKNESVGGSLDLQEWVERAQAEEMSYRQLKRLLNREIEAPPMELKIVEMRGAGEGFRMFPFSYEPERTPRHMRKRMLECLKEAVRMLEEE